MTEQDINRRIAEFMGFINRYIDKHKCEYVIRRKGDAPGIFYSKKPNYCNDLNEVWEVEEKLKEEKLHNKYKTELIEILVNLHGKWNDFILIHATAKEKCEAIIKILEGSE